MVLQVLLHLMLHKHVNKRIAGCCRRRRIGDGAIWHGGVFSLCAWRHAVLQLTCTFLPCKDISGRLL